jgi:transposase
VVLPKRWIVERTFAWLMKCRRLVRDYEATISSSMAWIWTSPAKTDTGFMLPSG